MSLIKEKYCYSANEVNYLVLLAKMPRSSPPISRQHSLRLIRLSHQSIKEKRLATSNHELGDREISTTQQEIVTMTSQGVDSVSKALPDIIDIDTRYLRMTAKEMREHTVKDFLSRPVVVSATAANWPTTATANTALSTYNFPDVLITNDMYQQKLQGFVGLRATLNVRVQVNSQPFQAGRLMLQYIPYAQYSADHVSIINSTLQGRSGCPRTDLDLSVGTEITMQIPYVSPHAFYNLITGQGTFGTVYVVVYAPLRDVNSGTQSVEYTVWAWLTDVEVEYPTGAPLKTTGFGPNSEFFATAQMGLEDKQLRSEASPSAGVGQISEGLTTLSRIPIVGNIFTRPAWISAQASNIMKLLGYSKTTSKGSVNEMKQRGVFRMANYNGMDMSQKLALACDNEIETQSGLAGTSIDEMHISRIISIPNYWDTFLWDTSTTSGIIWQNLVTPVKIKSVSSTVTDRFVCTHLGFVANTFGLWRGSLVYTFKFVKTQFHSGRLRISFYPFAFNTNNTSNGDTGKCYQMIVDLRDSTEVSFTVPYVSSRPWMFCTRPESPWVKTTTPPADYTPALATGVIQVEILNQLKAASTVTGPINVLVEVSGGPDMEFADPSEPTYVPYGGSIASATPSGFEVIHHADAQIFLGTTESIPRNDAQLGLAPEAIDTESIDSNWSPTALCVGEKVMSVRQLIKRFTRLGDNASSSGTGIDTMVMISPFSVTAPASTVAPARGYSQFEYWFTLYAFWRGSMRFKTQVVTQNPGGAAPTASNPNANIYGYSTGAKTADFPFAVRLFCSLQDTMNALITKWNAVGASTRFFNAVLTSTLTSDLPQPSTTLMYPTLEGMLEYEIPYYNSSHITPTVFSPNAAVGAAGAPVSFDVFYKGLLPPEIVTIMPTVPASPTNVITYTHYRAPGDDFSFFYLLGVPPLVNIAR